MTATDFSIRIAGDDLVFSAAHLITLQGGVCERLHGHSYRVTAEACGPPNDCGYLVDFVVVRDALKAIIAELDHRVLLPTQDPALRVSSNRGEIR